MATDNVYKNSLVISNGTTSKAIQNVKTGISKKEVFAFGKALLNLTGSGGYATNAHLVRQIPVYKEDDLRVPTSTESDYWFQSPFNGGGTIAPKIQLKWNDTVYTADKSSACKFTVKSTDEGVTSLGDHKYLFFVPCEQGDNYLVEWAFTGMNGGGVYCGLSINNFNGSVYADQFSYALMCYIDASDANKEAEETCYENGKWKFWVVNSATYTYSQVYCNFYFEEVN